MSYADWKEAGGGDDAGGGSKASVGVDATRALAPGHRVNMCLSLMCLCWT